MDHRRAHRRELVILAIAVVGLSRLLDGPLLWLTAGLLAAAVAVGAAAFIAEGRALDAPIEGVILPALAAASSLGAIRVVPLGILLVPALAAAWVLVDRTLAFEGRMAGRDAEASPDDRTTALGYSIVIAFLAFVGIATFIQGGLVEPAPGPGAPAAAPLDEQALLLLALADALVAGLLGFRVSVLRERSLRDALWSAATYAAVVAIAAAAVRAVALPRLLAPALLALVFFVWDGVHGAPPTQRRDPRWIWQIGLLVVLGAAVEPAWKDYAGPARLGSGPDRAAVRSRPAAASRPRRVDGTARWCYKPLPPDVAPCPRVGRCRHSPAPSAPASGAVKGRTSP